MSDSQTLQAPETSNRKPAREPRNGGKRKYLRRGISTLFWIYLITKVFLFDIDIYALQSWSPQYLWVIKYKFLLFPSIVFVLWLFSSAKDFLVDLAYVSIFPFILFFIIFKFLVVRFIRLFMRKSWIFRLTSINILFSIFRSFKFKVATTVFFCLAVLILFKSNSVWLVSISIAALLTILFVAYLRTTFFLFRPSAIAVAYTSLFGNIHGFIEQLLRNEPQVVGSNDLEPDQVKKRIELLHKAIFLNRLYRFAGEKLRIYQVSGVGHALSAVSLLLIVLLTVFSFACISYGLFQIKSTTFYFVGQPSFFTFFYYSFSSFLFNSIQDLVPITPLSQSFLMVEYGFAIFAFIIFVSILLPFRSQRQAAELDKVILSIELEGRETEQYLSTEFALTLDEAIAHVETAEPGFIQPLKKFLKLHGE